MDMGFGAFGKMPSAGDFIRLAPPAGFVRAWDAWLQQAMMDGQGALGAAWDDHYMSAPIWRFTLAAGLAGPHKVIGVLMPSVDRVGRRFPLTLVAALETPGPAARDHFMAGALFEQLEDLALAALEDTMTVDRLTGALADIALPLPSDPAPLRGVAGTLVMTGAAPGAVVPDLASGLLAGQYPAPAVFSAIVHDAPRMMICPGLPQGPSVPALFDLSARFWQEARPL